MTARSSRVSQKNAMFEKPTSPGFFKKYNMPRAHSLKISPLACHLTHTISLCSFILSDLLRGDFFLIFLAKKIHDVGGLSTKFL